MRHDPQRFCTFALGAFAFVYYLIVGYQTVRIWRRIGKNPLVGLKGPWGERLRTLGALANPLIVLAWSYAPERFARVPKARYLENWPVRLLGLWCLCSAAAILWVAYAELGDSWRIGIDHESPGKLIDTGIYSSIRHPVYSAFWLWLLGIFLMAPNLIFALIWAVGAAYIVSQAYAEEEFLASKYGKTYRDYMLRTGRFLPLWY